MSSITASVLIPVKNGGLLLHEVLTAVRLQKCPFQYEIIIIDSGSSDQSVAVANSFDVKCLQIAPQDFGHGKTRNQLARLSQGQFLVYITQDAIPSSPYWLTELVSPLLHDEEIACSFGPHIAHHNARLTTRKELAQHFAGFGAALTIDKVTDPQRFESDPGYRQYMHFLSSNNACIRRSVWEQNPFPEVNFAEDQAWCLQAMKLGYAKAFCPDAAVYHSHDFNCWETLQRNFDEARSFANFFGYRIQPSLTGAMRSAIALAVRDAKWIAAETPSIRTRISHSVHMSVIELFRVIGQFLGTKHDQLPKWLTRWLSRDESLQRMKAVA